MIVLLCFILCITATTQLLCTSPPRSHKGHEHQKSQARQAGQGPMGMGRPSAAAGFQDEESQGGKHHVGFRSPVLSAHLRFLFSRRLSLLSQSLSIGLNCPRTAQRTALLWLAPSCSRFCLSEGVSLCAFGSVRPLLSIPHAISSIYTLPSSDEILSRRLSFTAGPKTLPTALSIRLASGPISAIFPFSDYHLLSIISNWSTFIDIFYNEIAKLWHHSCQSGTTTGVAIGETTNNASTS